ncbi:hypothetical protein SNARM312S_03326 [Streptomyces narbonensis]
MCLPNSPCSPARMAALLTSIRRSQCFNCPFAVVSMMWK